MTTALDPSAALATLVRQLEATQWVAPEDLVASQHRHLVPLAEYCQQQSPQFGRRLAAAGVQPQDLGTREGLARLPVMSRRDLQASQHDLFCRRTPRGHGDVTETRTSGSSGVPVVVRATEVSRLFWRAMAMRELTWHGRDLTGRLCSIRANVARRTLRPQWGPPASHFAKTGSMLALPIATAVPELVAAVVEFDPTVLVTYPSTLGALAHYCRRHHVRLPSLQHILTTGETLSPQIRADAEAVFGAALADCYSAQEIGYIASQCPDGGAYHVMAESVIAEVLTPEGRACGPGEIGQVVITDLHNYATPLVRYGIGDVAEVGAPCRCGRGLPTWTRIIGRERNLIAMPDGRRYWPVTGFLGCRDVAPVVQYQFIQRDRQTIEVRLVVERPLTPAEEDALRALFHRTVGYPFAMPFTYFPDRIPAGRSDKFEEFVCLVPESD